MQMLVHVTGMTIDVRDEEVARLYQSRGFAVPVIEPEDEGKKPARKRAQRKTDK